MTIDEIATAIRNLADKGYVSEVILTPEGRK